ncbi:MAG: hypothetical protein LC746_13650 [Acidobacteria bacterium]|nr:hypothetical protein [Acidobacteriota bacterium]
MSATAVARQIIYGLFELDDEGTVLYSRVEPDGETGGATADVSGRNFYEEVAPFENVEEFRRRVAAFAAGSGSADRFNFSCRCGDTAQPVKVLLARVRERMSGTRTKSVLVHIRKGA